MPNQPDAWYDRTKPWTYLAPNASNEDRLTQQALVVATESGADIQEMVRPPLPQVELFRPRFGYRNRQIGIADIIDVDAVYPEPVSGAEGTSRYTQGSLSW